MQKISGLRTAIYRVGDINKAKQWYSQVFETDPYFDEPFYVGFNIAGYELGLQPEETPTTDKKESVIAYWGVDNVEATFGRLVALGAIEFEKPQNVGGDIIVGSVKDLWSNIIGLIHNPHFKVE